MRLSISSLPLFLEPMPIKPVEPHRVRMKGVWYWRVTVPKSLNGGKQRRECFKLRKDADARADSLEFDRRQRMNGYHTLSGAEKGELMGAVKRAGGVSQVVRAVEMFVSAVTTPRRVSVIAQECLDAKANQGISKKHKANLARCFNQFSLIHGQKNCHEITPKDCEEFLGRISHPRTRNGFRGGLISLFNYAVKMEYTTRNPAAKVDMADIKGADIFFLTVDECERLMRSAEANDPELIRYLALCLFGGLRRSEATRLSDDEITEDYVEVKASQAHKTKSRRLVKKNPALKAWLEVGGDWELPNYERRQTDVILKTCVPFDDSYGPLKPIRWDRHCMRHSFVTYGVPIYGTKDMALWAGHSEDIQAKHYKNLATKEQGERFFALRPSVKR